MTKDITETLLVASVVLNVFQFAALQYVNLEWKRCNDDWYQLASRINKDWAKFIQDNYHTTPKPGDNNESSK